MLVNRSEVVPTDISQDDDPTLFPSCGSPIDVFNNDTNLDFRHLPKEAIRVMSVNKGEAIHRVAQPFSHLYKIRSGFAKTEICDQYGDYQIVRFMTPGDGLGMKAYASGEYTSTVVALTDCQLLAVDYRDAEKATRADPYLHSSIYRCLAKHLSATQQHLFMLNKCSREQKLAYFLTDWQKRLQNIHQEHDWIELPMNRDDLKSYLGMTPESLSRAFTYLEEEGYLKVHNRQITEIDFEGLQRFVDGNGS